MSNWQGVTERLARDMPELSPQLRKTVRYVLEHPSDVATLSMRKLAAEAGVPPATTARVAQAAGFDSWEEFREVFRDGVRSSGSRYSRRAESLQHEPGAKSAHRLWARMRDAALHDLEQLFDDANADEVFAAADALASARNVYVLGLLSSSYFAGYLHYVAQMTQRGWHVINGAGGAFADDAITIGRGDALVSIAFSTYARPTVQVTRHARDQGATVIAITDTLASPLVPLASRTLLVPTGSAHFFESYVAAAALIEAIVARLVSLGGRKAAQQIEQVDSLRYVLGEYWEESD
jgi:DNA-binding MurR/RpiR family transcriptional regulator